MDLPPFIDCYKRFLAPSRSCCRLLSPDGSRQTFHKPYEQLKNVRLYYIVTVLIVLFHQGADGDPVVFQSACWFLDTLLAKEEIHIEKLQLVTSACYWIAQKMHQTPSSAVRLVKAANFYFTAQDLQEAERGILKSLVRFAGSLLSIY